MNSIRQRLLFWQISALIVTSVLVSAFTYHLAWQAFNRVRDYSMEQIAYSVVRHGVRPQSWIHDRPGLVAPPPAAPAVPPDTAPRAANDLGLFISQIWSPEGELLYASVDGTGPPLQAPGFHDIEWSGEAWRVFTLNDDRTGTLLDRCAEGARGLHGHLEEHGISVDLVFQIDQLCERCRRLEMLLDVVLAPKPGGAIRHLLIELVTVGVARRSVRALFRQHTSQLARKVAERSAASGEHYITRDWPEYRRMLRSAAGGGAVMASVAGALEREFIRCGARIHRGGALEFRHLAGIALAGPD